MDKILYSSLKINIPISKVCKDKITDSISDRDDIIDNNKIFILYLDFLSLNIFNTDDVGINLEYIFKLPNKINLDLDSLKENILNILDFYNTIKQHLISEKYITNDGNFIKDISLNKYTEFLDILNTIIKEKEIKIFSDSKYFFDNELNKYKISIIPEDLIELDENFEKEFNDLNSPIMLRELFDTSDKSPSNVYGIIKENKIKLNKNNYKIYPNSIPPKLFELLEPTEFVNYIIKSSMTLFKKFNLLPNKNSFIIIIKDIIYILKKNNIFVETDLTCDYNSVDYTYLNVKISKNKIIDALSLLIEKNKLSITQEQNKYEKYKKNTQFTKINETNKDLYEWKNLASRFNTPQIKKNSY